LRGFSDSDQGGTNCYPTCEYVFFLNECASDEACIPTRGTDWYDQGRYQQAQYHTWDVNNIMILSAWKYSFQGIANVNSIIYQVDQSGLTDEEKDVVNAELRGICAYYYSQLLDQFGDVPIVTDFEQEGLPEKSSRSEVFRFVESELKDIMDNLPSGVFYGRFTQNVANSILARIYLNAEVYTGTPRCRIVWMLATGLRDMYWSLIISKTLKQPMKNQGKLSSLSLTIIKKEPLETILLP